MKRCSIVAAVVVVVALIVVPAAFAGFRPVAADGYTPVATCTGCHGASIPPVSDWAATAHASVANNTEQSNRAACAGCHSGNFDPAQPVAWDEDPASPGYGLGDNPTEARVACSSCHFNMVNTHKGSVIFNESNPDPNFSPLAYGRFANPEVCGQCHDQRSQAKAAYPVYNPADPANPVMTILRFWPGYDPYTTPLTDVINVGNQYQAAAWPGGYASNIHDTGAVQYDEMLLTGGHFDALTGLNTVPDEFVSADEKINLCAGCHSTDQRILVARGKLNVHPDSPETPPTDVQGNPVTKDQLKYGVTCVACHDPHARGDSNSVWGGEHEGDATERNAQLIMPRKDLCASCHNDLLPEGESSFEPAHNFHEHTPIKEFMNGIGAIDVPKTPALHKGLCVQCHMVPTAISGRGEPTFAANHVFTPIMPEVAMTNVKDFNLSGTVGVAEAEEETGTTTVTITTSKPLDWTAAAVGKNVTIAGMTIPEYNGTWAVTEIVSASSFRYENTVMDLADATDGIGTVTFSAMPTTLHMPYSACSTCHEGTNGDNAAKTEGIQEIIDQRQEWTHTMFDEVMATLDAKAVANGFADAADAIDQGFADTDVDFGKAWTNAGLVRAEGSWGVHNWQYGVAVINKAMEQAGAVRIPATLNLVASTGSIKFGGMVTLSGTVTASGPALQDGDQVRLWANGVATSNFATLSGNSYSFADLKPSKNTDYRVQFLGDVNYRQALSNIVPVTVAFKVTLKASKSTLTAGTKLTLSGTVGPIAGPVNIQRFVNGNWQAFKNGVAVNSSGKFSYTFTIKKGSYSFRAVKPATATNLKGASSTVKVTAK